MTMNINSPISDKKQYALLELGFRIFFLGAGIVSLISISLWTSIFLFQLPLPIESITRFQWHAHEMIYGYSIAVIAGFLLTAVRNWTGIQTPQGGKLLVLFGLWAMARLLFLFGSSYLALAGFCDLLFLLLFVVAIGHPVIKAKQWKQLTILSILILFLTGNIAFYVGAFSGSSKLATAGIYGGLYLVIALILVMGRRVIPFFIEKGVGYPITLFNALWLDVSTIMLFIAFVVTDLILHNAMLAAYLALGLFIATSVRLIGWYTQGIWKKSLLWSLYLAFWFIGVGFLLFAMAYFFDLSKYIAIHALTVGGIGVLTMSMMSRVALGHTGRDVSKPPRAISYALSILVLATVIRVFFPIVDTTHYFIWIGSSQLLWTIAFFIFTIIYLPILTKPRIGA